MTSVMSAHAYTPNTHTHTHIYIYIYPYIPTPPLGHDRTPGQFLSGV